MYVERLSLCGGEAFERIRQKINFHYLHFPKSRVREGGLCCLARNQMLSAITFSMLFILYLVAVRSCVASARENGNWAEQTKGSHSSFFFLYYGFFGFYFLAFLSLCVLLLIFCFFRG